MRYEQPLFRPPSEAYSLILQVTIGCSHNRCTFCSMYKQKKFRVRSMQEIREDIAWARARYHSVSRIFLADGDALAMETGVLLEVLAEIKGAFGGLERISVYAGPGNILAKTVDELKAVREAGVTLAYFGLESGDEQVLREVKKGVTPQELIVAGRKVQEAGIELSATVILGLGGRERWVEHAVQTAEVASRINPSYLAALTLMVHEDAALAAKTGRGEFSLLSPRQSLEELKLMIEKLEVSDCVFRSNHASNYYAAGGRLPADKKAMLAGLERALKDPHMLKEEYFRGF
ncbi:MAG: B12-binding domain-containing radical SAM protein [Dethiobacter sp.]|nr:B12-binding domain-containing radical SAM protein [Dethiobacter sp.]